MVPHATAALANVDLRICEAPCAASLRETLRPVAPPRHHAPGPNSISSPQCLSLAGNWAMMPWASMSPICSMCACAVS
jgi:hypothetical protein